MRRAVLLGFALSGFGQTAITGPVAAQTTLDRFLSVDQPCYGSAAYKAFSQSLNDRYNFDGRRSGNVQIPDGLEASFGSPTATNKGGHTEVIVPVANATYLGTPVRSLGFYFGHSNGINVRTVVFAADLGAANRQLGGMVRKANAQLRKDMAEVSGPDGTYIQLVRHKQGTQMTCDLST